MIVNRKRFVVVVTFLAGWLVWSMESNAQPLPTPPVVTELQAGDLIWPKKPGKIVPYDSGIGAETQETAKRWDSEKNAYIDALTAKNDLSAEEQARLTQLSSMTYSAFKLYYFQGHTPGEPTKFGFDTGPLYTGHVGIIRVVNKIAYVVEAMWDKNKNVHQLPYDEWIRERKGEVFWLGRLKDVSAEQRAQVAEKAAEELGRPYNFWNFDLSDDNEFYCSKLAWLSIRKVTGFAPDDNLNPKRVLWYSPKQLMESNHIELKVNPGQYLDR
jgi:hypothetical protein